MDKGKGKGKAKIVVSDEVEVGLKLFSEVVSQANTRTFSQSDRRRTTNIHLGESSGEASGVKAQEDMLPQLFPPSYVPPQPNIIPYLPTSESVTQHISEFLPAKTSVQPALLREAEAASQIQPDLTELDALASADALLSGLNMNPVPPNDEEEDEGVNVAEPIDPPPYIPPATTTINDEDQQEISQLRALITTSENEIAQANTELSAILLLHVAGHYASSMFKSLWNRIIYFSDALKGFTLALRQRTRYLPGPSRARARENLAGVMQNLAGPSRAMEDLAGPPRAMDNLAGPLRAMENLAEVSRAMGTFEVAGANEEIGEDEEDAGATDEPEADR